MCTLSYLPLSNGYFLVNNRDESPFRGIAKEPQIIDINAIKILAPIDAEALGTWIGVNENGKMACLMNGAFEPHIKRSGYKKSRGKITLEFLDIEDDIEYFDMIHLEEIEPFSLIIIDDMNVKVLRWDGTKKYKEILSKDNPYNWSSATLYDSETMSVRRSFFDEHVYSFSKQKELLVAWHKDQISDSPSILLKRELVESISITSIYKDQNRFELIYEDLLLNKSFNNYLDIRKHKPFSIPRTQKIL